MNPRFVLPLVCLILLSCGKNSPSNVAQGNLHKLLYLANGDDPQTLDPQLASGLSEANILRALFEGLVSVHPETNEVVPAAAERWTVSPDQRTYHFYLRKNAHWSNGDQLTSQDFIYAWHRILKPETAAAYAYFLFPIKNAEKYNRGELGYNETLGVSAPTPYELIVELNQATPWFLKMLDHFSYYPLHSATVDQAALWTRPENMVSNGPFQLEQWKINDRIMVSRNTHYWDTENIHLKGIIFFPITDKLVEERAFRSEQIHLTLTPSMAIEKIAAYKSKAPNNNEPEIIQSAPLYASVYYNLNTRRPPFDNPLVRQALAFSIDRKLLVEKVLKGGQQAAWSFVPPGPNTFQAKKPNLFDPEKARRLLDEAGFPNGNNFPTIELLFVESQLNHNLAVAIQQMWKKNLNINLQLRNQEWKAFFNTRAVKDFDISSGSWYADYLDPSNFFEIMLSQSGNNHTHWQNPRYDKLVQQAIKQTEKSKRFSLYAQANEILTTDMPVIPLFYPTSNNLVQTNVKNWHHSPMATAWYKNVDL